MNGTDVEVGTACEAAEAEFLARFPGYASTAKLDRLRATDYRRLDESGQVYLDYTGGSLYAVSQLEAHRRMLETSVFGNPHSNNPSSAAMTEVLEESRRYAMRFFNASPEEYTLIFTPNASGALKLV